MEAKELMIGDWVYDKMLKGYGKIEVLTPYAIQCDIHTDTHHMDFFEPIPLTEEMLIANGFVFNHQNENLHYRSYHIENLVIIWHADTNNFGTIIGMSGRDYNYVHDLQHVLRLCRLNDLADNFKLN